jgi:hypothetical protein
MKANESGVKKNEKKVTYFWNQKSIYIYNFDYSGCDSLAAFTVDGFAVNKDH